MRAPFSIIMGCCFSFKKISHQPKPPIMPEPDSNNRPNRASPPPPCLEEETVKEVVLSETPLPKPQQNPKENTTQMRIIQESNVEVKDLNLINKHEEGEEMSQVSPVSDIYSISESFSTATTTTTTTTAVALTEIKDDEAISKATNRDLTHRSPAKVPRKRPNAGEFSRGAKSPAKRADSSRVMSRPVQGRTVPRNGGQTVVSRESGGGSSSRRMRSLANGTAGGVGRRSPGKVMSGRSDGKLRVENEGQKEVNDGVLVEKSDLNESLDNPHVSLECFIFL